MELKHGKRVHTGSAVTVTVTVAAINVAAAVHVHVSEIQKVLTVAGRVSAVSVQVPN